MKKLIKLTSLLLLLLCTQLSYGNHILGTDLSYRPIDSLKYEITIEFYRNCNGVTTPQSYLTSSGNSLLVRCSPSQTVSLSPTLISIESLKIYCDTGIAYCTPANTAFEGPGVEKITFKDTIDFTASPFNSLYNCSGEIVVEIKHVARDGAITTGPSGLYYNSVVIAELGQWSENSSPRFLFDAIFKLCCDEPTEVLFTATDADGDSLSYHFDRPLRDYNQTTAYSGIFSYQNPFTVYYPSGSSFPTYNTTSYPPIGVNLNPLTGALIFTPTNCSEVTAANVEVKEWRKNSSGVYQHISSTYRDIEYNILTCQSNLSPTILQDTSIFEICENRETCFDIPTTDTTIQFGVGKVLSTDTLSVTWSNSIPGASFVLVDSTALFKTGRFCWTPPTNSGRVLPYFFTVNIKDQNCPIVGQNNKAFYIYINDGSSIDLQIDTLGCGYYKVSASYDTALLGIGLTPTWSLLDKNENGLSSGYAFVSSSDSLSHKFTDTLFIQQKGNYYLTFRLEKDSTFCPLSKKKLLKIDNTLHTKIISFDTAFCTYSEFTLYSSVEDAVGKLDYFWSTDSSTSPLDSIDVLTYTIDTQSSELLFKLKVVDSLGCEASDSLIISSLNNVKSGLNLSYKGCHKDTITLTIKPEYRDVRWSNGDRTQSTHITKSINLFAFYVDTLGCRMKENTLLNISDLPTVDLADDSTCGASITIATKKFISHRWNTGDTTQTIKALLSGIYSVEVVDSNGCRNSDSAYVTVFNNRVVNLGKDTAQCGGVVILQPDIVGETLWSTGDTTFKISVDTSDMFIVSVTDADGCISADTLNVTIHTIPSQDWPDTLQFCSDTGVVLVSSLFEDYLWNTGETLQSVFTTSEGLFTVLFEDSNACLNTESIYVLIDTITSFTLGNDTAFCGDSALLTIPTGNSYVWSTGDTLNYTSISTSGDYSVTLTDANGCSSSDTVSITLYTNLSTPTLTRFSDSVKSNLTGIHYWFLDDVPSSDANTNSIYINNIIGSFTAVHQDTNGCISDTSNSILRTLGIGKLSSSPLKVYPNPTNGQVTIDATALGIIKSVTLYNSQGQLVENTQSINGSKAVLQWTAGSGVCWVSVTTDKGTYRAEVVNVR